MSAIANNKNKKDLMNRKNLTLNDIGNGNDNNNQSRLAMSKVID